MNNLNVVGRLTKDAELSYIPKSGVPVCKMYVAVERKYQADKENKKVDFIPCEFVGNQCEKLSQYLIKGAMVNLIGEIHFDKYKTKEGNDATFTKMHIDNLRILDFNNKPKPEFTPAQDENMPF